jgi:cytochrome c553
MTRHITAALTTALCAIVLSGVAAAADGKAAPAKAAKANASATLTGCLHADGSKYRLTNIENAPKGRNWKTAYITKSSKDVELVGAPASMKLKDHVGHKVAIAGMRRDEGHFQPQSLKQTWQVSSCS